MSMRAVFCLSTEGGCLLFRIAMSHTAHMFIDMTVLEAMVRAPFFLHASFPLCICAESGGCLLRVRQLRD